MVEHTGIELPIDFVEKHKEVYYIGNGLKGSDKENTFYLNISSKYEIKGHWEILSDLENLLKGNSFNVYAVILWEDGKVERYNLSNGTQEVFFPNED